MIGIVLLTSKLIFHFSLGMAPDYHCPACKSIDIIEKEETIYCSECNLDFFKECLGEIDDENVLSKRGLKGVIDSLIVQGDKESREKLLRALEADYPDSDK